MLANRFAGRTHKRVLDNAGSYSQGYTSLKYLYLGHSPKSIADKHYVHPSQNLLDEGLDWLGEPVNLAGRRGA